MNTSKKFNCSNFKDKYIFIKYLEYLGYSVERDLIKKVKVIRRFKESTKTFIFVIDMEALELDFDNYGNLIRTRTSVTY